MELTALQDHQPDQIRGSGTPSSVRPRHSTGSRRAMRLARRAGSFLPAPPTVAQARRVACPTKVIKMVAKIRFIVLKSDS